MEFKDPDIGKFLSDPLFLQLVKNGSSDPGWKEYERLHWERREAMKEARLIVLAAGRFPSEKLDAAKKKALWEKIDDRIADKPEPAWKGSMAAVWRWSAAAAVVLMSIGISWWWYPAGNPVGEVITLNSAYEEKEVVNRFDLVFPVDLPDGSTALLKPGSKVRYNPGVFEEGLQREVFLDGEAFFEVVSNPESPFYVYANGLITKVLGTSFNVKALPGDPLVEVVVKTGRVAVFPSGPENENSTGAEPEGEVLNPDERVVLDLNSRLLSIDKLPAEAAAEPPAYIFDDVSVAAVFEELQRGYNVRILYPRELLQNCRITAVFSDEPLYEKIRLICRGLGATYKVLDGEIIIDSDGCT